MVFNDSVLPAVPVDLKGVPTSTDVAMLNAKSILNAIDWTCRDQRKTVAEGLTTSSPMTFTEIGDD